MAEELERSNCKYEYEPKGGVIEWVGKVKKYTPDFVLANGIIVETKGRLTVADRVKHLAIQEQHPDLDIRFVFQFDNKLTRTSKTRYSEWATKHHFTFAIGLIPKEWCDELRRDK